MIAILDVVSKLHSKFWSINNPVIIEDNIQLEIKYQNKDNGRQVRAKNSLNLTQKYEITQLNNIFY